MSDELKVWIVGVDDARCALFAQIVFQFGHFFVQDAKVGSVIIGHGEGHQNGTSVVGAHLSFELFHLFALESHSLHDTQRRTSLGRIIELLERLLNELVSTTNVVQLRVHRDGLQSDLTAKNTGEVLENGLLV